MIDPDSWVAENLLDPRGAVRLNESGKVSAGPVVWRKLHVGILDNGKANARFLLDEARAALAAANTELTFTVIRKPTASLPAAADVMARLVQECDVVVTGTGDCGSCTAWTVRDTIELESRGIPAVMFVSDKFVPLAEALFDEANLEAKIVVGEHPFGGRSEGEARVIGRGMAARVLEVVGKVS
ncbi:hypothetical protein [Nocardioides sp. WS12]|uniref:UGSC family (seleno)protein n=1 Tax=Nocardioides sp. WS12 TaxID=2486272 RepID=UPI0015F90E9A|nr:hypothetical protein [Nocardioides sp. WS12]